MMAGMRTFSLVLAVCTSLSLACGAGGPDPLPPPAEGEGFQLAMKVTAPPGTEVWKCQIAPLPIDDVASVHSVRHVQSQGVHHMDVMVLLYSGLAVEPGLYDCGPLYEKNPKLMEDVTLYASQLREDTIVLPQGVAAQIPPRLMAMQEIHYVNSSNAEVEVYSKVNAYVMPGEQVKDTIWGVAVRDRNLNVPPGRHVEWTRCVMEQDIDLLFISSHTHAMGEDFTIHRFDGEQAGALLYRNQDWHAPQLMNLTPPLRVPAGQGFEFRCHYNNRTGKAVKWGFSAEEEMCQIGIVFTPGKADIRCRVVETSDGVIVE